MAAGWFDLLDLTLAWRSVAREPHHPTAKTMAATGPASATVAETGPDSAAVAETGPASATLAVPT